MKVVFHNDFYKEYTSDPAAEAGRMEAIVTVLGDEVAFVSAKSASAGDIAAIHSAGHVADVKRQGLHEIAALAAGGAIQAAEIGLAEPAFGLIRPPGHHASAASCWGFCFYNNMAIALGKLKRDGRIQTAFVLDIDLHYGDGTVNILEREPWVVVHNGENRQRATYLKGVEDALDTTGADMIGISAGFDNHLKDWGGVLTTDDYTEIGCLVKRAAVRNRGG
jgi:acetoin utilization deacetylase AcuC-like enzyme